MFHAHISYLSTCKSSIYRNDKGCRLFPYAKLENMLTLRLESLLSILILSYLASPLYAQLETNYTDDIKIDIINITIRKVKQRENVIRVSELPADNRSVWGRITCEYLAKKDNMGRKGRYSRGEAFWIDECVFSWRILLLRKDNEGDLPTEPQSVLLKREITYGNIMVNNKQKHYAVIYIEPSILEHYGKLLVKDGILVNLQIKRNDNLIATSWANPKNTISDTKMPTGLMPSGGQLKWFDSTTVIQQEYGLLNRLETPWAWSNYNSYEFILNKVK